MKVRLREREGEGERGSHLPGAGSLSTWWQRLGLDQEPGAPSWVQEPENFSSLLLSQAHQQEAELGVGQPGLKPLSMRDAVA